MPSLFETGLTVSQNARFVKPRWVGVCLLTPQIIGNLFLPNEGSRLIEEMILTSDTVSWQDRLFGGGIRDRHGSTIECVAECVETRLHCLHLFTFLTLQGETCHGHYGRAKSYSTRQCAQSVEYIFGVSKSRMVTEVIAVSQKKTHFWNDLS